MYGKYFSELNARSRSLDKIQEQVEKGTLDPLAAALWTDKVMATSDIYEQSRLGTIVESMKGKS